MKRILRLIAPLVLILMTSACTKIYGPSINVVEVDVPKTSWKYSNQNDNNFFYATVSMPEIDAEAVKMGMVQVYRIYNSGTSEATQVVLPYVHHIEYYYDGDWYSYTETIDYEFKSGKLTIFYTASDFEYEVDKTIIPDAMRFRCVVLK